MIKIRPSLEIRIYTVPGSAWIRWQYPNLPPLMFDPAGGFHAYGDSKKDEILKKISASDLVLIQTHLRRHAEARKARFAEWRSQISATPKAKEKI
jgi:hypothetical protein